MPLVEAPNVAALWINRQTCATRFETHMQARCDKPGFTFVASNYKPTRKQPANGDVGPSANVQVLFHSVGTGRGKLEWNPETGISDGLRSRGFRQDRRWATGAQRQLSLAPVRVVVCRTGNPPQPVLPPSRLDKMQRGHISAIDRCRTLGGCRTGYTRGPRRQHASNPSWGWWVHRRSCHCWMTGATNDAQPAPSCCGLMTCRWVGQESVGSDQLLAVGPWTQSQVRWRIELGVRHLWERCPGGAAPPTTSKAGGPRLSHGGVVPEVPLTATCARWGSSRTYCHRDGRDTKGETGFIFRRNLWSLAGRRLQCRINLPLEHEIQCSNPRPAACPDPP